MRSPSGEVERIVTQVARISDYPQSSLDGRPLLSIVTTVRNGERTLPRTIASIRDQGAVAMEYIVIDACSTDRTLDIIRANADVATQVKSEPDHGISDGFNKGIALSRGKYVTLLNADDWLSPGQLTAGLEALERTGADFVFGDLIYHGADGAPLHVIRGEADYATRIGHVMPGLNHPTVIVRRDAYERFGLFDLDLRFAMDYEMLLRLHRAGCKGIYEPRVVGHMSLEGASDASSGRALAEVRDVSIRHGASLPAAWMRYALRLAKGHVRRSLERILPADVLSRLRGAVNKNYARPR
jgi:glycosyltransferase involved in cell wall biosynthesis